MIIPIAISLPLWANNLVIDFPGDNIPQLLSENDWRTWGDDLVQCTTFSKNNSPGTANYGDWQAWAQAVHYTMTDT